MKTICPHCNQEFPETPDEYQGMTLECPSCHQNFVCEKPRFCTNCKTFSPANALQCSQCGKFFEKPKFCPECGAPNHADTLQCSQCGKFFEKPKFCPECGTPNHTDALQCSQCGTGFPASRQIPEPNLNSGNPPSQPGRNQWGPNPVGVFSGDSKGTSKRNNSAFRLILLGVLTVILCILLFTVYLMYYHPRTLGF